MHTCRWRPVEPAWRISLPLEGAASSSGHVPRVSLALSVDPWVYAPYLPSVAWTSPGQRSIILQVMEGESRGQAEGIPCLVACL